MQAVFQILAQTKQHTFILYIINYIILYYIILSYIILYYIILYYIFDNTTRQTIPYRDKYVCDLISSYKPYCNYGKYFSIKALSKLAEAEEEQLLCNNDIIIRINHNWPPEH